MSAAIDAEAQDPRVLAQDGDDRLAASRDAEVHGAALAMKARPARAGDDSARAAGGQDGDSTELLPHLRQDALKRLGTQSMRAPALPFCARTVAAGKVKSAASAQRAAKVIREGFSVFWCGSGAGAGAQ